MRKGIFSTLFNPYYRVLYTDSCNKSFRSLVVKHTCVKTVDVGSIPTVSSSFLLPRIKQVRYNYKYSVFTHLKIGLGVPTSIMQAPVLKTVSDITLK